MMTPDRQGQAGVDSDTFDKGVNNVVKDMDMEYPPEWRLGRSNRRKP